MYWTPSDIEWASRWDAYLAMPNGSVHWFSILNSLLVVLVMSVIVAVILMRTVRRDLAKYEELLVEGQVRRTASHCVLLMVYVRLLVNLRLYCGLKGHVLLALPVAFVEALAAPEGSSSSGALVVAVAVGPIFRSLRT